MTQNEWLIFSDHSVYVHIKWIRCLTPRRPEVEQERHNFTCLTSTELYLFLKIILAGGFTPTPSSAYASGISSQWMEMIFWSCIPEILMTSLHGDRGEFLQEKPLHLFASCSADFFFISPSTYPYFPFFPRGQMPLPNDHACWCPCVVIVTLHK